YQFSYADGAAEDLARKVREYGTDWQESPLPLLQVICTRLYGAVRQRAVKEITKGDIQTIADIKLGLRTHLPALIDTLFAEKADRRAFRALLVHLYRQRGDGLPVPRWLLAAELAPKWRGLMPFEAVVTLASGPDVGLLRISDDTPSVTGDSPRVTLGHPVLA